MISCYILSIRSFLKRKGLSDARVVSITKKEYGFLLHFLWRLIKSLKSISDELWDTNYLSSGLLEIFIIK